MQPLVPVDVDLRDFAFMPVDVQRLLMSETWMLGSGDERAAAMTLWLVSWHQVPAGSLPNNDRMLAHFAQAKNWPKIKAHVMRGWQIADDGRYYHPVVAEKALEAWLEKLAQRLSSGAGNAKRWGVSFDPSAIEHEMQAARVILATLNPQSRTLSKRRTSGVPSGSKSNPSGNPGTVPPGVPSGSQGTGTGTGNKDQEQKTLSAGADDGDSTASGKGAEPKRVIPAREIVAAYHRHLPMMPAVKLLTDERKRKLKARWTELAERQTVDYWERFFAYVASSDWLTGRDGKWTACDFEWLIEKSNHLKVSEGKYENREPA